MTIIGRRDDKTVLDSSETFDETPISFIFFEVLPIGFVLLSCVDVGTVADAGVFLLLLFSVLLLAFFGSDGFVVLSCFATFRGLLVVGERGRCHLRCEAKLAGQLNTLSHSGHLCSTQMFRDQTRRT